MEEDPLFQAAEDAQAAGAGDWYAAANALWAGGSAAEQAAQQALAYGLQLGPEALQALSTLPQQHIAEFLEGVAKKVNLGVLSNPDNYICAAIKRGYTPNDIYHQTKGEGGKGRKGAAPPTPAPSYAASVVAAQQAEVDQERYEQDDGMGGPVALQVALQKVQLANLTLTDEAIGALAQVPAQHAAEILEHVADKCGELRDPSNYVVATIARGYQPRTEKGGVVKGGKAYEGKGKGGRVDTAPAYDEVRGGEKGIGKPARTPRSIPQDILPIEVKLVEVNCEGLWGEQQFDVATLLALRCLPQEQAFELLESFAGKARNLKGKGKGISNINNYMQAAVVKIQRGEGSVGGSANFPAVANGSANGWPEEIGLAEEPHMKRTRWSE